MTSTPDQVISVLKLLAEYYNHEPTETQASIYLDALSDLDPVPLQESARRWIRRSPFFPKVSDLLNIARTIPKSAPDTLAYRVQALEDAFYEDRALDPQAWLALADEFERADRPHRALTPARNWPPSRILSSRSPAGSRQHDRRTLYAKCQLLKANG